MPTQHAVAERARAWFPGYRDVGAVFLEKLEKTIKGAVLLDIGCGRATFGAETYKKASKRIGIDLDPYAVENTLMDEVHILEPHAPWPVADGSIDVVSAQWVVEHVDDPDQFFAEVRRVLKPGGTFIFMTTNRGSWLGVISRLFPTRLKSLLRAKLLGYAEDETFPTCYLANTKKDLERVTATHRFTLDLIFVACFDYLRFSKILTTLCLASYKLTKGWLKGREVHLVGVCTKMNG